MSATGDLIDDRRDDATVQHTRISLEVVGSDVGRLYLTRRGFVDVQMQSYGILQATDEALAGVRLAFEYCILGVHKLMGIL